MLLDNDKQIFYDTFFVFYQKMGGFCRMKNSNSEIKQRRQQIVTYLKEHEQATVAELSQKFKVSEMTIRRDCNILANMGNVTQKLGVISYQSNALLDSQKNDSLLNIKEQLAKKAADYVIDGQTIFINSSMTAINTLKYLTDQEIIVLTNNVAAIQINTELKASVMLSGGEIRRPKNALTGDIAYNAFSSMRANLSIIGCRGLCLETGISTSQIYEAKINRKIIENSSKLIVVADYTKIGKSSNFTVGNINDIDILITDSFADLEIIEEFRKQGVEVIQITI